MDGYTNLYRMGNKILYNINIYFKIDHQLNITTRKRLIWHLVNKD